MAVSTKTHGASLFRCAIASQAVLGTATTTQTAFYELHVSEIVWPDGSDVLGDDTKRSDGKMVRSHTDTFRSVAGGTATVQVSGIATKETLAMLCYAWAQDITSEGAITPFLKTFTLDDAHLPVDSEEYLLTLLVYNPSTDNHVQLHSAVCKTLTIDSDAGSAGGRVRFTATLYSGFPLVRSSVTATPDDWVAPSVTPWTHQTMVTKTIAAADMVMGPISLTFENNAARYGYTSTGNAEGYAFGLFDITGTVDVKYDANSDDLGDAWYLDPAAGSAELAVVFGWAAVANVKEFSVTLNAILTAPEALSATDRGVFTQFALQAVDDGTNPAAVIKIADEIEREW